MRILTVHAHAFGPLTDAILELAPGLTVVHGPNEAGKSTWHAALYAGLCGMRRGPGRRGEDREFRERHAPWDGDAWEVGVVVELADGRRIELRHDLLGRVDSVARDLGTGRDISGEIMGDGAPDGARFLGLDRRTLPATICVRQADVLGILDDPAALQHHLQRAAATGGTDATVEEALERIRAYRSENVGLARRGSTKPRQRAAEQLDRTGEELEAARRQHEEYRRLLARAEATEVRAGAAEEDAAAVRRELERSLVDELERRLGRARELATLSSSAPPVASGERDLVPAVSETVHDLERLRRERRLPDGPTSAQLESELDALPEEPAGDTEVDPAVDAAHRGWREALRLLDDHRAHPPEVTELEGSAIPSGGLRRIADDLETPLPEVDRDLTRRYDDAMRAAQGWRPHPALLLVALASGLVAVGVLTAGSPVLGAVLAVLAVGAGLAGIALGGRARSGDHEIAQLGARLALQEEARAQARERRERARQRAEAAALPPDAEAIRRAAAATDEAATMVERTRSWQERGDELERRCAHAAEALRLALEGRDVDVGGDDPDASVSRYREACRGRAAQARAAARRPDLLARLESRRAIEDTIAEERATRREILGRARELATRLGAPVRGEGDAVQLTATLRGWLEEERARDRERRRAHEAAVALRELLGDGTLEELEAEVQRGRAALPADVAAVDLSAHDLPAHAETLDGEARRARAEADMLRGQVTDRHRGLASLVEAEEAHDRAREELSRVERLARTLDLTQEFLETARDEAQRDIAPRLTAAVAGRLAEVTRGRYEEVAVDPADLDVHVRAPGGRWRRAALLSHGTAEQIYLLLRTALAEHIITTSEPAPLLLDDVTVQADDDRTEAFLELLLDLSAERQIVLFSQEQEVRDWAVKHLDGSEHRLVELDPAVVGP